MSDNLAYLPSVRRVVACVPPNVKRPEDVLLVELTDDLLFGVGAQPGDSALISLLDHVEEGDPGAVRYNGIVYAGHLYFPPSGGVILSDRGLRHPAAYFPRRTYEVLGPVVWLCGENGKCHPVKRPVRLKFTSRTPRSLTLHWNTDANGYHRVGSTLRAALLVAGFDPDDWEGWGWTRFLDPADAPHYVPRWESCIKTGSRYYNSGSMWLGRMWGRIEAEGLAVRSITGRVVRWTGTMQLAIGERRRRA